MLTIASSSLRFLGAAVGLFVLGVANVAYAESKPILVTLDRARIVKVPEGTQTLIIGNPLIADVTMLKGNGSMVVTGRSFGSTNLISLDSSGNAVDETTIKVTGGEQTITVLKGTAQESYSCNPRCAPTVALGDDGKYLSESIANVKSRNGASLSGGK
jgi:Flp pilus assembly secretin CpaC